MPLTSFKDVVGKKCHICGGWATHYYGCRPVCCDCHAGRGYGLVDAREMAVIVSYHREHGQIPPSEEVERMLAPKEGGTTDGCQ